MAKKRVSRAPEKSAETPREFQLYHKAVEAERNMADLLAEHHTEMEGSEFLQFIGLVLCLMADRHFTSVAPMFELDPMKLRGFIHAWASDIADKVCDRLPDLMKFIEERRANEELEESMDVVFGLKKSSQTETT